MTIERSLESNDAADRRTNKVLCGIKNSVAKVHDHASHHAYTAAGYHLLALLTGVALTIWTALSDLVR